MKATTIVAEKELAAYAEKFRFAAGVTRAQAAREMEVKPPSLFHAEQSPTLPYKKLRVRMIETYSDYEVIGPVYLLRKKK